MLQTRFVWYFFFYCISSVSSTHLRIPITRDFPLHDVLPAIYTLHINQSSETISRSVSFVPLLVLYNLIFFAFRTRAISKAFTNIRHPTGAHSVDSIQPRVHSHSSALKTILATHKQMCRVEAAASDTITVKICSRTRPCVALWWPSLS